MMSTSRKFMWLPGRVEARLAHEERPALAAAGVDEEAGHEPTRGRRRRRPHVPEVEQAGEPNDDVEPQGHYRERQRLDRVFDEGAARVLEEGQDYGPHYEGDQAPARNPLVLAEQRANGDQGPQHEGHEQVHLDLIAHPQEPTTRPAARASSVR